MAGPLVRAPPVLVTLPWPFTVTVKLKAAPAGFVPPDFGTHALGPVDGKFAVKVKLHEIAVGKLDRGPMIVITVGGVTVSVAVRVYWPLPLGRVTASAQGVIALQDSTRPLPCDMTTDPALVGLN
jgi:hypothetical protein